MAAALTSVLTSGMGQAATLVGDLGPILALVIGINLVLAIGWWLVTASKGRSE